MFWHMTYAVSENTPRHLFFTSPTPTPHIFYVIDFIWYYLPQGGYMNTEMEDPVNHPKHYTDGGIEVIEYIRAKLGKDGYIAYCMGNVYKYTSRYKHKGGVQDLQKAKVYLDWAIQEHIKG